MGATKSIAICSRIDVLSPWMLNDKKKSKTILVKASKMIVTCTHVKSIKFREFPRSEIYHKHILMELLAVYLCCVCMYVMAIHCGLKLKVSCGTLASCNAFVSVGEASMFKHWAKFIWFWLVCEHFEER